MYFTKQDYEKILGYVLDHSKKDTEFERADALTITGEELLSIVQNNVNRNIKIGDLIALFDEHGLRIKIAQEEGESLVMVMSQKAITDSLNDIRDIIDLDAEKGTVQQQIDAANEHLDNIDETIGGSGSDSIQNQLQSLRDNKLQRGLDEEGGDLVDALDSSKSNKALTANQGRILQGHIDEIQDTVDTFVHGTIVDRGMAVTVSGQVLSLEFTPSDLDTIYVQQVGDVLSLTNVTQS